MTAKNDVAVVKQNNSGLVNTNQAGATITPLVDIFETPEAYVLVLDMPGSEKESISITLDNASLKVRGRVESGHTNNAKLLHKEIDYGTYQRSFNLTDGIDSNNVDAQFENGVLTIKLFKKDEVKPKEIRIK